MPEAENKTRAGKREIPIPKPTTGASEDVLRDETDLYGDEAEIAPRRRKRTDARVPIMKKRGEAAEEAAEPPEEDAEEKPKKKEKTSGKSLPKIAPAKKQKKKKKPKKRRIYRSLYDLMTASGSNGPIKPIRVFGREIRFWPLIILAAVAILAGGVMLNNSNLTVTEQTVTVVGLPNELEGYRIVVLSDMNGKRFGDEQSLLLRTLNGLKYDAIFCVGDMVGASGNAEPFWEFIEGLRSPEKVYFICGDSDPGPYPLPADPGGLDPGRHRAGRELCGRAEADPGEGREALGVPGHDAEPGDHLHPGDLAGPDRPGGGRRAQRHQRRLHHPPPHHLPHQAGPDPLRCPAGDERRGHPHRPGPRAALGRVHLHQRGP